MKINKVKYFIYSIILKALISKLAKIIISVYNIIRVYSHRMSTQEFEQQTGWRPIFHNLPINKSMAQKVIMPLGLFYSPFLAQAQELRKGSVSACIRCKAAINQYAKKDRNMGRWICNFCEQENSIVAAGVGQHAIEQTYEGKSGDCGMYFIIDLCISKQELQSIKETLINSISKLPENIFVGLMVFNRNVMIANFEGQEVSYVCFNGDKSYGTFQEISEVLGAHNNPNLTPHKIILDKYYVPLSHNLQKLTQAISDLQVDSHFLPRELRYQRASGAAIQVAVNSMSLVGINTRFVTIIGGPCTIGPGMVVQLPIKKHIRVYMDIFEGTQNSSLVKTATKFYETLAKVIIQQKCTMDMWAYGLDQFGLLQMKEMVNQSGGLLAMHELFNHYIFKQSFQRFYQPNESGLLDFPFTCELTIRISKQMRINGILGTCKSLKQNILKSAADMEIGEGGTNVWYLGGLSFNNALCILISHADIQNKTKGCIVQAITKYKYSDNIIRTKVSTINLDYLRQVQIKDIIRSFDENAAAVMLARMACKKAEVEDVTQVKKWLDRILLKFAVRFAYYNRGNRNSFRLPEHMKYFPQYIYHLRRSSLVNSFGSPPDQSIYMRTCLLRQSLPNCTVMIQSALFKYSQEYVDQQGNIEPQPVQLDIQQMQDDTILLMDSYFTVIVWFGSHIYSWKEQKLNETPQYQYLTPLFQAPMKDASEIMYDRLPISNFYETFKFDGKQRYLKARVNPSKTNNSEMDSDGHFVTDDASINVFMEFLVKSVVNYSE